MLRVINAALNNELFFRIANHSLTIVEADASYVKPFNTNVVLLSPGQTVNLLLKTERRHPNTSFLIAARAYASGPAPFNNSTTIGVLEYLHHPSPKKTKKTSLFIPKLPVFNDTSFAASFSSKIRSLASPKFPAKVPQQVDRRFFFTVGIGTNPCSDSRHPCQGPNNSMLSASMNNISFVMPNTGKNQYNRNGHKPYTSCNNYLVDACSHA